MLRSAALASLFVLHVYLCYLSTVEGSPVALPVIGGERAKKGESPWLVSLKGKIVKFFVTIKGVYCGGSLIHDQWVMTAAHCVDPEKLREPTAWSAVLGTNDIPGILDKTKNIIGKLINKKNWTYVSEKFEKIIIHPDFSAEDTFRHDIALMKLKNPIAQHPLIKVVRLPNSSVTDFPADNSECFFTGWGCTEPNGSISKRGQKIRFRMVSDAVCSQVYGVNNNYHFCAGEFNANKGICQGDSGSPLVCFDSRENPIQVGIASFSSNTRSDKVPGGFVRVAHYVNWIKETIRRN